MKDISNVGGGCRPPSPLGSYPYESHAKISFVVLLANHFQSFITDPILQQEEEIVVKEPASNNVVVITTIDDQAAISAVDLDISNASSAKKAEKKVKKKKDKKGKF